MAHQLGLNLLRHVLTKLYMANIVVHPMERGEEICASEQDCDFKADAYHSKTLKNHDYDREDECSSDYSEQDRGLNTYPEINLATYRVEARNHSIEFSLL